MAVICVPLPESCERCKDSRMKCATIPKTEAQRYVERANDDDLLNKFELAHKLHVSKRTVDEYMKRGWLNYFRLGKTIRFRWSDVLEKLNERRVN